MVFLIARTLRRSYLRHFPGYTVSAKLLTSCSLGYQLSSVKYSTMDTLHLRSLSKFQALRNRQPDFLSLVPLKSHLSLHLWKPLSSRSAQVLSKVNSVSRQEKPAAFTDSDTCLLFDTPGILISQLTFAEAKALADNKKCRLVYMHKNSDGVFCFQLQALKNVNISEASNVAYERNAVQSSHRGKLQKNTVKEFKIQSAIGDHDLSVKLNKMKSLLTKGKQLKVHIMSSSNESKNGKGASAFIKQLTEELGDICKIKQEFAKDTETCLSMTPNETADKPKTQ